MLLLVTQAECPAMLGNVSCQQVAQRLCSGHCVAELDPGKHMLPDNRLLGDVCVYMQTHLQSQDQRTCSTSCQLLANDLLSWTSPVILTLQEAVHLNIGVIE